MSLSNFAVTQGGGTDTVTTTMILDGTIANADVASDAAIDVSKINLGNTMEMETSSGDQIFEMDNNAANSSNFQINNGAGNARTDLYLDGSAVITLKGQSVGIGDTSPSYALDVNDTGRFTSDLIVGGNLTVGDGGAEDQKIVFDGNAQDFYVGLDDTTDDLVIGLGSAVGTTAAISINEDQDVTISDGAIDFDVASHDGTNGLKLGGTLVTASATELNLIDGYTGTTAELNYLDVTTLGTSEDSKALTQASSVVTVGATDGDQILNIASHDLVDGGLKLAGTLVTASAAELNLLDGKGIADEDDMSSDSASNLSTQQSIKAYVDAQTTADTTVAGDSGSTGISPGDTLTIAGGSNVATAMSGDTLTITGTDTNTTYTAGDGLDLTSTTFSTDLMSNGGLEITSTELSVAQGISQYDVAQYASGVADNDFLKIDGTAVEGRSASEVLSDIAALPLAGGTMTGTLAADDQQVTKPRLTDYSETVNAIGSKTAAFDIDLEDGNVQTLTMSGGGTFNIGIVNAVSSHSNSVTILGTNLGSCTGTFLAGANGGGGNAVYWAGGGDTSNNLMTSSGTDCVTFTTFDGGTNWYGFVAGKEFANS